MKDRLVAHRGDMTQYVENTLPAIQAAIDLHMRWIEVDIQISSNAVPIVIHDNELARITGENEKVTELTDLELFSIPIILQSTKQTVKKIPSLTQAVELLNRYPDITLFVEVKKESVAAFGLNAVMDSIASVLEKAKFDVVIISFLYEIAELAKSAYQLPMGWVLTEFNEEARRQAQQLKPKFIFCNVTKVAQPEDLWTGTWHWVLYDIINPRQAHYWMRSQQVMVETGDIVQLMNASIFDG